MSNQALQVANQKRHILAEIRKHGLVDATKLSKEEFTCLQALISKHGLSGVLRMVGKNAPCMQTFKKRAEAAGIEIPGRGRPAVYPKAKIVDLYEMHKTHKGVQDFLESKSLPVPTLPMLVKWAKEAGIKITRGRPALEKSAA